AAPDRALLRQGAGVAAIPIDVLEADDASAACGVLASGEIDIVFLDAAIAASMEDAAQLAAGATADGVVIKPRTPEEARVLVERSIRVRLPTRVLVVD